MLAEHRELATFYIGSQLFGIPVLDIEDIINPQEIFLVPLAPPDIGGVINLRGRVVTALDLRVRLGIGKTPLDRAMNVVIARGAHLYSLLVDSAGDVLNLPVADFETHPPTLEKHWAAVSSGIFRLENQLLVVLDIASLLSFAGSEEDS